LAERAYIQSTYGVVRDAKGSENNDDNDDVKPEKPSTNKPPIWKPTSQPGVKDLSALAESFAALADKARADALPPIDLNFKLPCTSYLPDVHELFAC